MGCTWSNAAMQIVCCALVAACRQGAAPVAYPLEQAPASLRPAIERADAVIAQLQQRLASRLMAELQAGDAVAALGVCREEAQAITAAVAQGGAVAVGRTSFRVRNPLNAPKPWAEPHVLAGKGRKAAEVQATVVDLGRDVGVLRPIGTAALCLRCHGDVEQMAPQLRQALAEAYPGDQAVGFVEGDLRGYFWAVTTK